MTAPVPVGSPRPERIGIIGLGRIGAAIAERLREAGVAVAATDLRPEAAELARTIGVSWCDSSPELADASTIVLTVLPGPGEVRDVIEPVLGNLRTGAAWIDMTTGVPALSDEIRARAGERVHALECPIGGDPADARQGRLLGYLGAEEQDRIRYRWLLDLLCRDLVHAGAPGTGYLMKLLTNLLWFGQAIAVSEALAFAARLGLDPQQVRTSLARGPAASRFVERDALHLLGGDDMATFGLAHCLEQLEGIVALAGAHDLELGVAAGVRDAYLRALARYGDADGELLGARLIAEDLGVDFGNRAASSAAETAE
ncbi:MAG TPA: NAD(P)-dependent oxidoreductase [Solirubrobacteraceae bacterium]|nr:NAD(P)-dependent oxidoreductase [Solirubrobacteraceae bacterium]